MSDLGPKVDYSSPIPFYAQMRQSLEERIARGAWKPGERLPSEWELCEGYGVSRTVVRQALQELEQAGLIVRRKGKGTFVAEPKIREGLVQKLTGWYQDMLDRGMKPVTRVLRQEIVPCSPRVASYLDLEPGALVFDIERLRFAQGEPVVLVRTYLPQQLCPTLASADLSSQSLYAFIEQACGLVLARGRRVLEAVAATEYEANLLEVPKGAPLIMLDSVTYLDDGTPIEYYHALHRGDRSQFEVELVRMRKEPSDLPPSHG